MLEGEWVPVVGTHHHKIHTQDPQGSVSAGDPDPWVTLPMSIPTSIPMSTHWGPGLVPSLTQVPLVINDQSNSSVAAPSQCCRVILKFEILTSESHAVEEMCETLFLEQDTHKNWVSFGENCLWWQGPCEKHIFTHSIDNITLYSNFLPGANGYLPSV